MQSAPPFPGLQSSLGSSTQILPSGQLVPATPLHGMGTTQMPGPSHAGPHPLSNGFLMHSKLAGHGVGDTRKPPQAWYDLVLTGRRVTVRVAATVEVIVVLTAEDAEILVSAGAAVEDVKLLDSATAAVEDITDGSGTGTRVVGTPPPGAVGKGVTAGASGLAAAKADAPRTARILRTSIVTD